MRRIGFRWRRREGRWAGEKARRGGEARGRGADDISIDAVSGCLHDIRGEICPPMASDRAEMQKAGSPVAAEHAPIRAVVFDFGEVLCDSPDPAILARMAAVFGIAPEAFVEAYHPTRVPYDRGDLTPELYWRNFAKGYGVPMDDRQLAMLEKWDHQMWSRINRTMTEWLARLHHQGYRTAILSNMQAGMVEHVRQNFDWLSYFDCQVFSCEVRMVKPDAGIYEHLLGCLAIPAGQVLFIDDRAENVAAARAAGIVAVQMTSLEQLRSDLAAMGFPILPQAAARDLEISAAPPRPGR
jgi:putative hydrolase of the HAD superfamily